MKASAIWKVLLASAAYGWLVQLSLSAGAGGEGPALADVGADAQTSLDTIEKIKKIASESKKQAAGIEQLQTIARAAKLPAVKKAAIHAAADLYVEQGKPEEAMQLLAAAAVGEAPRLPSDGSAGKGPLKLEKAPPLAIPHLCGVTADFRGKVYVLHGLHHRNSAARRPGHLPGDLRSYHWQVVAGKRHSRGSEQRGFLRAGPVPLLRRRRSLSRQLWPVRPPVRLRPGRLDEDAQCPPPPCGTP